MVRCRRGLIFDVAKLILANHMHGCDTANDDASAAKGLQSQHGPCDPFNGPIILFDDVVEILRLAHRDGKTTVGLNADDGGLVGPAFVDGDLLGHVVQADSRSKDVRAAA